MFSNRICTQGVRGSNPLVSTNPHLTRGSAVSPPPKSAEKAEANPLHEAADAFLLSKRVAGCTEATLGIYAWWLRRLIAEIPPCDASRRASVLCRTARSQPEPQWAKQLTIRHSRRRVCSLKDSAYPPRTKITHRQDPADVPQGSTDVATT